MADEEESAVEEQLELQLREQKDSLDALDQALASDPSNVELLSVREEVVQAIKDAEEGLLHLKRARLLREADYVLQGSRNQNPAEDVSVEELDSSNVEVEPLEDRSYNVGSKCRFRYTDGRWYNGLVVAVEGPEMARISFLTPTSEKMLMCKFFLQQRCRFGSTCRLSHGIDVPLSSLREYIPTIWDRSLVGSNIWALPESKSGIWKEAELESWDEKLGMGHVVFRDNGSSAELGAEAISLSEYAEMSDDEDSDTSSEDYYAEDDAEDDSQGLGFLESTNLQRGIQTETTIFARWENHTRGIASKMMANMGYREGMGLGASGQGMVDPIPVRVLPPKQSLDHAVETLEKKLTKENHGKKRSRGGKRKRDKKFAEARRAAKEEEESRPDVFTLINSQLALHGETPGDGSSKKQQSKDSDGRRKEDRKALIAYDDEIKELKSRAAKLEEMATRNKKEKVVYSAAMRKLDETRKALADVQASHASASNAVASKEREKKWLKF